MYRALLALVLILPLLARADAAIEFKLHGNRVGGLSIAAIQALVPPSDLVVWEPHESRQVTYRGFSASELLDKVYGRGWRNADEILFTCADGYQPALPVTRFLKYQGLFAYQKPGEAFSLQNKLQADERVDLGPLYLVWNNVAAAELRAQKGEGWPYQVVAVDIVSVADRFPRMFPGNDASSQVKRGFQGFRQHCFACHKMNGDGGGKSIDLHQVTAYRNDEWLERWMIDPQSIRPGTAMPALTVPAAECQRVAADIVAYLKYMASRK